MINGMQENIHRPISPERKIHESFYSGLLLIVIFN